MALQGAMSRRNEAAVFIDEAQKRELLKGLFDNYYHAVHPYKVVFDTNRAWCSKLPTLVRLFPEAKVVCRNTDYPAGRPRKPVLLCH
jgi:sulfotransferase